MYALPPEVARDRLAVSGISCPDCHGVLGVRAEGRDAALVFECRIHHTYDLGELCAAREERLGDYFWGAITRLDELATLLAELSERGRDHGESEVATRVFSERADRLRALGATLRELVRANAPLDLSRTQPGTSAPR